MATRTYAQLKTQLLILTNGVGSDELGTLADTALLEVMRYIARNVPDLPALVGKATATWPALPTTTLSIATDFGVTNINTARRLYVRSPTLTNGYGPLYTYRTLETYHTIMYPARGRYARSQFPDNDIFETTNRVWTIDYTTVTTGQIMISQVSPADIVTLFYTKDIPTTGVVPLPGDFDNLLLQGAQVIMENWIKEGENLVSMERLLERNLDMGISTLRTYLLSLAPTPRLKLAPISSGRYRR